MNDSPYEIRMAIRQMLDDIDRQEEGLKDHSQKINNLEAVVTQQAEKIKELEGAVVTLRNDAIKSAVDRGVPTKVVAEAHNITSGRVSQIAPRRFKN